jgi:hypothetical protein
MALLLEVAGRRGAERSVSNESGILIDKVSGPRGADGDATLTGVEFPWRLVMSLVRSDARSYPPVSAAAPAHLQSAPAHPFGSP